MSIFDSESTFESEITRANCNDEEMFRLLSDLRNIERVKHRIPEDKIQDLTFDADSCSFSISPLGKVGIRIVNREPNKTIKFGSEQSPMGFDFWIQLKQVAENDTRIKLTLKAKLNFAIKAMVEPMVTPMLNKMANALASLDYKNL